MQYLHRLRGIYNTHVRNAKKEARFLVLLSFMLTFIVARIIVYGISFHLLPSFPFSYIFYKDIHIHHLVFGIILLLIAGFIRIPETNNYLIRFSSIIYGIGAALTLDEFAIWLRLDPEAYFGKQGRISIDAVVIFTLILLLTFWYGNFFKKIFLFTISFIGVRKRLHHMRHHKRRKLATRILLFSSLGLVSFALAVTVFSQFYFGHKQLSSKKKLSRAIINAKIIQNTSPSVITITPSLSMTMTPSLTASTSSGSPTVTPEGFCMHVPVLMYHHIQPMSVAQPIGQASLSVDPSMFDRQMNYLMTNGYTTITAEQLVNALHNHVYLSAKSVVVTLDDAYLDNYTNAFPIAKKYHVILNIMVPTGLLSVHAANNYYFSWDQLKEMINSGLVYAYDHSWSHYPVGTGTIEKNQFEIMTAKQQLQQNLGRNIDIFTYPYGSGANSPWLEGLLQKDGFIGGYSTIGGTIQCDSFIMSLHRNHVGDVPFPSAGIN